MVIKDPVIWQEHYNRCGGSPIYKGVAQEKIGSGDVKCVTVSSMNCLPES